jgi:protein disulfide-isomerase A1
MFKPLLFLLCIAYTSASVVQLTTSNFDETVQKSDYVLVKFFAPWCGHCKNMVDDYIKLSNFVAESVVVAEVDATVESELAKKNGVSGYPTLKWFVKGTEQDYSGGRDFDSMSAFIEKETGDWVVYVESSEAFETLLTNTADALVLANVDDESARKIAASLPQLTFALCKGEMKEIVRAGTYRLYQKFDEKPLYTEIDESEDGIVDTIKRYSIPFVNTLGSKSMDRAFEYSRFHLVVVHKDNQSDEVMAQLEPVAKKYSPDYIFVSVLASDKQVVELFGIESYPTAVLIDLRGKMKKFPMKAELTTVNIITHLEKFAAGKIEATLKTQPIPAQENGKPLVLVGDTFHTAMKDKDTLVKFYAPWCGHCKQLAPVWDELAETFSNDENVLIAKYDATANENEGVNIRGYPSIKFYKAGGDEPIDYNGQRTLESFQAFIKEHRTGRHTEL